MVRASIIGALIRVLLYSDPLTVDGGDALTRMLLAADSFALPVLLMCLAVRFLAGPVC